MIFYVKYFITQFTRILTIAEIYLLTFTNYDFVVSILLLDIARFEISGTFSGQTCQKILLPSVFDINIVSIFPMIAYICSFQKNIGFHNLSIGNIWYNLINGSKITKN